jgi:hypothetical protein
MDNCRSFIETHLLPFFRDRPITAVTPGIFEDFIEAKRAPGGSGRSRRRSPRGLGADQVIE